MTSLKSQAYCVGVICTSGIGTCSARYSALAARVAGETGRSGALMPFPCAGNQLIVLFIYIKQSHNALSHERAVGMSDRWLVRVCATPVVNNPRRSRRATGKTVPLYAPETGALDAARPQIAVQSGFASFCGFLPFHAGDLKPLHRWSTRFANRLDGRLGQKSARLRHVFGYDHDFLTKQF